MTDPCVDSTRPFDQIKGTAKRGKLVRLAIGHKISITVIALVVTIAGFMLWYFPSNLTQITKQGLVSESKTLSTMIAYSTAVAIEFQDEEAVQEIFQNAFSNPHMQFALINSPQTVPSKPFAKRAREDTVIDLTPITQKTEGYLFAHNLLYVVTPIVLEEATIGTLITGFSIQDIQAAEKDNFTTIVIITLVIAAIGLFIGLLLARIIAEPINAVIASAQKMGSGNLHHKAIPVRTSDETGQLAATFNRMSAAIAESHAKLSETNRNLKTIFHHMSQGILTVGPDLLIQANYSRQVEIIFDQEQIQGCHVGDLLFGQSKLANNELSQILAGLHACIDGASLGYDVNKHLLPETIVRYTPTGEQTLELSWEPIRDHNDEIDRMMVIIKDITERLELEKETQIHKRELTMIGEIVENGIPKTLRFLERQNLILEENRQLILLGKFEVSTLESLFRNLHTVKGNCRNFGLSQTLEALHDAESRYDELRKNRDRIPNPSLLLQDIRAVQGIFSQYRTLIQQRLSYGNMDKTSDSAENQTRSIIKGLLTDIDWHDTRKVQNSLGEYVQNETEEQYIPFTEVMQPLARAVEQTARDLNKQAPQITTNAANYRIKTDCADMFGDMLGHIIRNAMDHGIEDTATREKLGKPPRGRIDIQLTKEPGRILLEITDDGRGLFLDRLAQKAKATGFDVPEGSSDKAIAQLVFRSGITTAKRVSTISGRGVGLDAVAHFAKQFGGNASIRLLEPTPGSTGTWRSFVIELTLPPDFAEKLHTPHKTVA